MPWRKCYFLAAWAPANRENRSTRSAGNWKLSIEQTGRENQIASARYMENDKGRTQEDLGLFVVTERKRRHLLFSLHFAGLKDTKAASGVEGSIHFMTAAGF